MTAQASDSFFFNGKRYALFSVSNNQVLSCRQCAGIPDDTPVCTANWKGYIATYEVRDNILYYRGSENFFDYLDLADCPQFESLHSKFGATGQEPLARPGSTIPFTGHAIITQGARVDFFCQLAEADCALELEFQEGILTQVTDLRQFVQAMRDYKAAPPPNESGRLTMDDTLFSCSGAVALLQETCPVCPRGSYTQTCSDMLGKTTCALCGNTN